MRVVDLAHVLLLPIREGVRHLSDEGLQRAVGVAVVVRRRLLVLLDALEAVEHDHVVLHADLERLVLAELLLMAHVRRAARGLVVQFDALEKVPAGGCWLEELRPQRREVSYVGLVRAQGVEDDPLEPPVRVGEGGVGPDLVRRHVEHAFHIARGVLEHRPPRERFDVVFGGILLHRAERAELCGGGGREGLVLGAHVAVVPWVAATVIGEVVAPVVGGELGAVVGVAARGRRSRARARRLRLRRGGRSRRGACATWARLLRHHLHEHRLLRSLLLRQGLDLCRELQKRGLHVLRSLLRLPPPDVGFEILRRRRLLLPLLRPRLLRPQLLLLLGLLLIDLRRWVEIAR